MISRDDFRAFLRERTRLFDGGYGTSFFEMGLGGVPAEVLNVEHPDAVLRLHSEYVSAGADMLLTNSFGGNRSKLAENELDGRIEELNAASVSIARRAAASTGGRRVLVFGDLSSTGRLPRPSGDGSFDECRRVYAEQARILIDSGVDGLIVETMTDIKEMKAALVAIREESPDVPLIAQMAFDASGTTLTGASIEVFAALGLDLDVDVLGMNCLLGPMEMVSNVRRLASCLEGSDVLISAEPNAGDPIFDGKRTTYPTTPAEFAMYGDDFTEAGADIIGGCCGTTPAHIRALASGTGSRRPPRRDAKRPIRITSRSSFIDIGGDRFTVIGERINPTGRKALREAMRARDWSAMLDEADAQSREGADVLDVNFGVEKFFDADAIGDAFAALDRATSTPLSVDVQTHDLMERAMAEYPGRPLVNSSACDEEQLARKLPLLKKYGGVMVLLAMDGEISPDPSCRMAAVDRALALAKERYGLESDRFVIDPLVMSVGAGGDPRVTLEVVRMCAERGLATTMGVSNLSHGMPDRSGINAAFISRAIDLGATSAIMNSGDSVVMQTMYGAMTLRTGKVETQHREEELDPLVAALLSGKTKAVDAMVDERLAAGDAPIDVSQMFLGGAMEAVGDLYENKKIFLPHILFAAETAFPVFDRLNSLMASSGGASRGRVMLATVEGDIHDIGKNIVATVLRAGGFDVTDIGKNVPADEVVRRAREIAPDIVGLSAMMTTTVGRVQEVRDALRDAGIECALITGGASMTHELARMFGARYSENSSGALALCKEIAG